MTNRDTVSSKDALNLLMEGNKRFINNTPRQYDTIKIREETKNHQYPFASILSCSDSRTNIDTILSLIHI